MISITGMSRTSPDAATTKSNALFINLVAGRGRNDRSSHDPSRPLPGTTAGRLGRSGDRVKGEFGLLKRAGGLLQAVVDADPRRPAEYLAGLAAIDLQGIDQAIGDIAPAQHRRGDL